MAQAAGRSAILAVEVIRMDEVIEALENCVKMTGMLKENAVTDQLKRTLETCIQALLEMRENAL